MSAALTLSDTRNDLPAITKPQFSLAEDIGAELHSIVHSRLLRAGQKKLTDLQRDALHGAALFANAADLRSKIDYIETELEADLVLAEHEAKLLKDKML